MQSQLPLSCCQDRQAPCFSSKDLLWQSSLIGLDDNDETFDGIRCILFHWKEQSIYDRLIRPKALVSVLGLGFWAGWAA